MQRGLSKHIIDGDVIKIKDKMFHVREDMD